MIDAEPLKNRDSLAAAEALDKIYKRKILSPPVVITCDQGVEFKSEFKKYCTKNNIFVRYGKKYRHRQTALAEKANARISRPLFKRMLEEEVLTEKTVIEAVGFSAAESGQAVERRTQENKTRP
jgi:hypothetical protein